MYIKTVLKYKYKHDMTRLPMKICLEADLVYTLYEYSKTIYLSIYAQTSKVLFFSSEALFYSLSIFEYHY